jgi:hypothetical protein
VERAGIADVCLGVVTCATSCQEVGQCLCVLPLYLHVDRPGQLVAINSYYHKWYQEFYEQQFFPRFYSRKEEGDVPFARLTLSMLSETGYLLSVETT